MQNYDAIYSRMSVISESQLRAIVADELRRSLDEGLWDDVKSGAKRLIAAVTSRISSEEMLSKVRESLQKMQVMPDDVTSVISALKTGMAETGEQVKLDETLRAAKELGRVNTDTASEMLAADLEGPVHSKMKQLQGNDGAKAQAESIVYELHCACEQKTVLNEFGGISAAGFALAGLGLLPIVFKGLAKLAGFVGAKKTATLLKKVEHVMHGVEEKVIDNLVPDVLSYAVYTTLWKKGFRMQSEKRRELNREEYSAGVGKVKTKVEKLLYSALLIFLAWNGIKAALNAGASLLGFAEGGASVVKGLEIGRAAVHIADVIDLA